jgi:hypothetical protein
MADTVNGRRRCLIGTLYNYFYFWDGSDTVNSPIVGPTFSNVTKSICRQGGADLGVSGTNRTYFLNTIPGGRGSAF